MIDRYIQEYGRRLYGLCLALCKNPFEAEDLYQETWLKVIANLSHYDASRSFEPWLARICVNTYRNALRRLARSPILDLSDGEKKERLIRTAPAPEREDYLPLHDAVRRLPMKLRLAVVLYYFADMDIKATAELLDIPAGTVKSRLSKARSLLKEALADEEDL